MPNSAPYFKYWGKTDRKDPTKFHLLPYHCLDVAAVGYLLLARFDLFRKRLASALNLAEEAIVNLICYFLSLHDIGKFSDAFQGVHPDLMHLLQGFHAQRSYSLRHDSLGYLAWEALWDRFIQDDIFGFQSSGHDAWQFQDSFDRLAKCASGHHGKPPSIHDGRSKFSVRDHFAPRDLDAVFHFACDLWRFHVKDKSEVLNGNPDEDAMGKTVFPTGVGMNRP